jgi:hypothetical protein
VGLVVRCAIVAFLCSRRFQFLGQVRFAIALFSIVMPGLGEVHANITNTHWYLGLYLLLLALAPYPTGLRQKLTDGLAIALCGISGPFALFALPAFGLRDLAHRRVHFTTLIAIACAGLQLVLIALTSSSRSLAPLGATWELLARLLSGSVYLGSFIPNRLTYWVVVNPWVAAIVAILCTLALAWAAVVGNWRVRGAIAFVVLLVTATLLSPVASLDIPQWQALLTAFGNRYWVAPSIVLVSLLLAYAAQRSRRALLVTLAIVALPGLISFMIRPVPGPSFDVTPYYEATPGEMVVIPIAPPGWTLTVQKQG